MATDFTPYQPGVSHLYPLYIILFKLFLLFCIDDEMSLLHYIVDKLNLYQTEQLYTENLKT